MELRNSIITILGCILCLSIGFVQNAEGLTFTVNSNDNGFADGDLNDGICDSGDGSELNPYTGICSWRAVQEQVSALAGAHTINFNLPPGVAVDTGFFDQDGTPPSPSSITIDGGAGAPQQMNLAAGDSFFEVGLSFFNIPEFHVKNMWFKSTINPNGPSAQGIGVGTGVPVTNCSIEDSFFTGLQLGILFGTPDISNCTIENNSFGIDPSGINDPNIVAISQLTGNFHTVRDNVISGTTITELISGPFSFFACGLQISGDSNTVENNKIGTDATGTVAVPNAGGVCVQGDNNVIKNNVISGNGQIVTPGPLPPNVNDGSGIIIFGDDNQVFSNMIGTDVTGNQALGNQGHGISITGDRNCIGGQLINGNCTIKSGDVQADFSNIISANQGYGVVVFGGTGNVIFNNIVGKAKDSNTLLGNVRDGISIFSNSNEIIDNIIVGNLAGISILGGFFNLIKQNQIGTNGNDDLGNIEDGIFITAGSGNIVGGPRTGGMTTFQLNNIISGNGRDGIRFDHANPLPFIHNLVFGNAIGTNTALDTPIPNDGNGISIIQSNGINIGSIDEVNVISGNLGDGISIQESDEGSIINNFIGISGPTGTLNFVPTPIPNGVFGIILSGSSNLNTIGGATDSEANFIGSNVQSGIVLSFGADSNTIQNNQVGAFIDKNDNEHPFPNSGSAGIAISSDFNMIQTNTVSNNLGWGISITGNFNEVKDDNSIQDNLFDGVLIGNTANNNKILKNFIGTLRGNNHDGISILGDSNTVEGNLVHNNLMHGITIIGDNNVVQKMNDISFNTKNGIDISGDSNTIDRNLVNTNSENGILISGSFNFVKNLNDISFNLDNGVVIDGGTSNTIDLVNVIGGNTNGVLIKNAAQGNTVDSNIIGNSAVSVFNDADGVKITEGSSANTISNNLIHRNLNEGVETIGMTTIMNTLTANSISGNGGLPPGPGIGLFNGIENINGGNTELAPPKGAFDPVATALTGIPTISGLTCLDCIVEIFSDPLFQGLIFWGSTIAGPGGVWEFSAPFFFGNLTCTATDLDGNTSEFGCDIPFGQGLPPLINEVDSDTPGIDNEEFIEIFDGGVGIQPLDGLILVLFDGETDRSYFSLDLDGFATNTDGYFVIGNAGVPNVDLVIPNDTIQNGADAVALYAGNLVDLPDGTPAVAGNLIDAIVYGIAQPNDSELLLELTPTQSQVNEADGSLPALESMQRVPDYSGGPRMTLTYSTCVPTPGTSNDSCQSADPMPECNISVVGDTIISSSCKLSADAIAGGNVMVQDGAKMTVLSDVTLTINFSQFNLIIKFGGIVLIESGGKIT